MPINLISVMKSLYASEINVEIFSFWDGGWEVKLGDNMNGYKAEKNFYNLDDAAEWLQTEALRQYPDSVFAKATTAD